MPAPPTFEARLIDVKELSRGVRSLVFERTDKAPFSFDAGQWVNVVLPISINGSPDLRRSYSIASGPNDSARFELAITRVEGGPGSTYLHQLEPGATLNVIGPQGFFTRSRAGSTPSLFIATGTGITPLRSMLHAAIRAKETAPLWMIFGTRVEEDILYREELEELAKTNPNVRVEFTLSRAAEGWTGRRGYVQTHVRELWEAMAALNQGAPHAYICGLQRMVGSVRDLLRKEMNIGREQVHSERYD